MLASIHVPPGHCNVNGPSIYVCYFCWRWAKKFGRQFASDIQSRAARRRGDKWHLDEAVISIGGEEHWLWRAVDQDGSGFDVLVQSRRNAKAAKRLMRNLLKDRGTRRQS